MKAPPYQKGSRKCRVCGKWFNKNDPDDVKFSLAKWRNRVCSPECESKDYHHKLKRHLNLNGKPACGILNPAYLSESPRYVNCQKCLSFIKKTKRI